MKTDVFQSCGHCRVFQICWHIECSTFTTSSFRIWNSSYIYVGINIYCAYDDLLRRNRNMLMNVIYKIQMYSLMCMCVCCCCCCCVASVVSDSVRPQRLQPTRLPCAWDSPGKNTGVGCHFLLQCMKVKSESEVAQPCLTLCDPMDCSPPGSFIHRIFQARVLEWGAIAFSVLNC